MHNYGDNHGQVTIRDNGEVRLQEMCALSSRSPDTHCIFYSLTALLFSFHTHTLTHHRLCLFSRDELWLFVLIKRDFVITSQSV